MVTLLRIHMPSLLCGGPRQRLPDALDDDRLAGILVLFLLLGVALLRHLVVVLQLHALLGYVVHDNLLAGSFQHQEQRQGHALPGCHALHSVILGLELGGDSSSEEICTARPMRVRRDAIDGAQE